MCIRIDNTVCYVKSIEKLMFSNCAIGQVGGQVAM